MRTLDFSNIVAQAWEVYGEPDVIKGIIDFSPNVSTNQVFKISFLSGRVLFAKLSYFGKFDNFREDHAIINVLANTLPSPYKNFLSRSLVKNGEVFVYRHQQEWLDAWVAFYEPIPIANKLPRRLDNAHIKKLGKELALFHKACNEISSKLPHSSKTLETDINDLLRINNSITGRFDNDLEHGLIEKHCYAFLSACKQLNYDSWNKIPVFVDWNIGNFSVTEDVEFYSRWDYDWFRMSSRVMDFYFFSRVVSDIGDKTIFSYLTDPLKESRFLQFISAYHEVFPLNREEVYFIKEAYRFFILNYVVKDGRYFFHEIYASRLQYEALNNYLPKLDNSFDPERIITHLNL